MPQNKFGEEMPEDEQAYREQMLALKQEYGALVQRGAPIPEVDAVRERMARLASWWEHHTTPPQ